MSDRFLADNARTLLRFRDAQDYRRILPLQRLAALLTLNSAKSRRSVEVPRKVLLKLPRPMREIIFERTTRVGNSTRTMLGPGQPRVESPDHRSELIAYLTVHDPKLGWNIIAYSAITGEERQRSRRSP